MPASCRLLLIALVGAGVVVMTGAARTGGPDGAGTLTAPKAVVLGVVEGVTEYLPISSTGHLLVAERLMDMGTTAADKDATDTFTVTIQVGAIVAVLVIYWRRVASMAAGLAGRDPAGRRSLAAVVVAFLPAAVVGQLFGDTIKEYLLAPWPVVGAWFVGGVAILAFVANQHRLRATAATLPDVALRQAAVIGVAQTLALWPGTSRSLVTILAALAVGLALEAAVELSFLLGLVTLGAATGYEFLRNGSTLFDTFGVVNPLLGTVVAGIAAFASVRWMLAWLQRRPLTVFGWYRIGASVVVAGLILGGVI